MRFPIGPPYLVIQPERVEARVLEESLDDLREPVEGVLEALWHLGVAEAGIVRREDVEPVGKSRDQVAELMRRSRKAAEQEQLGTRGIACLAIEDGQALDVGCPVLDCVTVEHGFLLSRPPPGV
jgi:hypothetical protein